MQARDGVRRAVRAQYVGAPVRVSGHVVYRAAIDAPSAASPTERGPRGRAAGPAGPRGIACPGPRTRHNGGSPFAGTAMSSLFENFRPLPDRPRAIANYRRFAAGYDATCGRIEAIRAEAVAALALAPGDRVLDVACGTGPTLPLLARSVGPGGEAVGVEQCPEMAEQARRRALEAGPVASVVEGAVEEMPEAGRRFDALLMCWTHDVLQSPAALDRLVAVSAPGARVAIAGMIALPWAWGWPVNAVTLWRSRHYATTWANIDRPFRGLEARGASLRIVRRALWGSAYLAVGRMPGGAR